MAKLAIDVVLNKAAAMTGLRGLEKDFMSFGRSVAGIAGIGGGLAGLVAGIDNILAKAGQLQDVSDAFNVSAESIQRLANVGITANLTIEEIGSKLGKLSKAAQEAASGNDEMAKTFAKIGVTGQDLVRLNPEQLFNKLREAVSSGSLANEEFTVTSKLLAKDYQRFMPLLRMTSEEFESLAKAGFIASDAMVASLDAANVKVRQFQKQVSDAMIIATASVLDLATAIKNNPIAFITGDNDALEKDMQERLDITNKFIEKERALRAGQAKMVKDDAEIAEAAKRESTLELRLIEAGIKGREDALRLIDQSEERFAQQSLDRARQLEEEKIRLIERRGDIIRDIEEFEAEMKGPEAELNLKRERAAAAGEAARAAAADNIISGDEQEKVREAFKLRAELARAEESELRRRNMQRPDFARQQPEALEQQARGLAKETVGDLPDLKFLRDLKSFDTTEIKKQSPDEFRMQGPENLINKLFSKIDLMPNNNLNGAESLGLQRQSVNFLSAIAANNSLDKPQKIIVDQLPLKDVLHKLDTLINKSGNFF